MTSKTFSTGTPLNLPPDIDGVSPWSLSGIDDTPLLPPSPNLAGLPLCPPPDLAGLPLCLTPDIDDTPLWLQPDIPLSPSPNNYYTHLPPTLLATPIKYEGFWGTHLVPPTLDTKTLPQELDEDQGFIFNLEEGNVQPVMSEKERIRKLEEEIYEVQVIKTIMLNELEVRTRRWTEFDEVKQRFEDMFVGFENRLAKIEAKMEEERSKTKASARIQKKPKEKGKSKTSTRIEKKPKKRDNTKTSGRIEKKPRQKPKKTEERHMRVLVAKRYVDLRQ